MLHVLIAVLAHFDLQLPHHVGNGSGKRGGVYFSDSIGYMMGLYARKEKGGIFE